MSTSSSRKDFTNNAMFDFSASSRLGGGAKKRKSEDGPRDQPKKRLSEEGLKSVRNTLARKSDLRAKIPGTGLSEKLKSRLGGEFL